MRARVWAVAAACCLAASAALASTLTVIVERAQLRKRPQFYAPATATVKLGDKLAAGAESGGWYDVPGRGYIHRTAVTARRFKLSSDDSVGAGDASAEEVTLAGKGFNEEVEKSYKKEHPALDFSGVDAMTRRQASDAAVLSFLKAGRLLRPGGER